MEYILQNILKIKIDGLVQDCSNSIANALSHRNVSENYCRACDVYEIMQISFLLLKYSWIYIFPSFSQDSREIIPIVQLVSLFSVCQNRLSCKDLEVSRSVLARQLELQRDTYITHPTN